MGPSVVGARHEDVDVLAGQEAERIRPIQRERNRGLGEPVYRMKPRPIGLPSGPAEFRRRGDDNNEVRLWPRLAGERQTLRGFFLGQRVLEVAAAAVLAGLDAAFAGATDTDAAVERDVDPSAIGGVGNGFVRT